MTQSSSIPKNQWSNYRPIAPLVAPQKILPRPDQVPEKRKWEGLDLPERQHERRGSGSSQGSNSSANAADQRLRRKEQNRAAQRAFRERKERYVKELEDKIKAIEEAHAHKVRQLEQENEQLVHAMKEMQADMLRMKDGSPPFSSNNVLNQIPLLESSRSIDTDSHTETSPASAFTTSPRLAEDTMAEKEHNPPSSAVACIRDKDGVSFCERLKEEVCYNAYEQLVSEPLFDSQGILNDAVSSHPVPIVTHSTAKSNTDHSELPEMFSRLEKTLTTKTFDPSDQVTTNGDLISCSQVWRTLAERPLFQSFDHDVLCDELKKRAKCSNSGPVFYEEDVKEVLEIMEKTENI
ncbi:hypothetical protein K501DRAFT_247475 [Backusella circina FSU 941]|nr:hypothetical protein K501DRAFT_247475 [Backusella circina FSU 941]